jgi:mono/diheme cytochrome c family protein
MRSIQAMRFLSAAMIAVVASAASLPSTSAQEGVITPQGSRVQPREPAKDYLQRSQEIYEFKKAAQSGSERGQEIFYYKCWFCHNEFVKDVPQLKGLYQHPNLLTGEPVNDNTVRDKIRNGGPNMAAYKYTLNDADVTDLVSYLREKCCWDSDAPPSNPRYRTQ